MHRMPILLQGRSCVGLAGAVVLAGIAGIGWGERFATGQTVERIVVPAGRAEPRAISADGTVVVGAHRLSTNEVKAFRWTHAGGLKPLSSQTVNSMATGVSADGKFIGGQRWSSGSPDSVFRWRPSTGTGDPLGQVEVLDPYLNGSANAAFQQSLSGDGRFLVGIGGDPSGYSCDASVPGGGSATYLPRMFGHAAVPTAISTNGKVVVGVVARDAMTPDGFSYDESLPFVWSPGDGELGLLLDADLSEVFGVNGDGTVVVGSHYPFPPQSVPATVWRIGAEGGGASNYPMLEGTTFMQALAVSADGTTVGGFYAPPSTGSHRAWIDPGTGTALDLRNYLLDNGVDATNWLFADVTAISMDGLVIAGTGSYGGQVCGYVVDLHADSDGDGLYDDWEAQGIPYLNLETGQVDRYVLAGANPLRKDIYVELDGTAGQLSQPAIDRVVQVFDNAPVPAVPGLDGGLPGISLHVDLDEGNLQINGNFTRNAGWEELHAVKDVHFGTEQERQRTDWPARKKAKAMAYRYGLCVNSIPDALGRAELVDTGTGNEPRKGTNDFMIGLGRFTPPAGRSIEDARAAAFMHELGHTLGLFHGGRAAGQNFNPNHYSVMNYLWAGVRYYGGTANLHLDYSDCEPVELMEGALNETLGIQHPHSFTVPIVVRASITASVCGDPPTNHGRCFRTNEQNLLYTCINHVPSQGPVDWNNDRVISPLDVTVCADPNGLKFHNPDQTLASLNEWEAIAYSFRDSPYYDDVALPTIDFPCPDEATEIYLTTLDPAPPPPACVGAAPVLFPPQPAAVSTCPGQTAEFTFDADGDGPFKLQWRWHDDSQTPPVWRSLSDGFLPDGGTTVSGSNLFTLHLENINAADFGTSDVVLSCRVTDPCGVAADTTPCTLSIQTGMQIVQASPATVVVCPGSSASFAVDGGGPGATYQWYALWLPVSALSDGTLPNGTVVSGAHSATLTFSNISTNDVPAQALAPLFCAVNDGCGDAYSPWFAVSSGGVVVTQQPSDVSATCAGTPQAVFTVEAAGVHPLSYQWRRDGVPLTNGGRISGSDSPTLSILSPQPADSGPYTCRVLASCGSAESDVANLNTGSPTLLHNPPVFAPACRGGFAVLDASAYGAPPLSYQWMREGVNLSDNSHYSGTHGPALFVSDVEAADLVNYSVRVSNSCGMVASQPSPLTLYQPLAFGIQPSDATVCRGGQAELSVELSLDQPGTRYFWEAETSPGSGQFSTLVDGDLTSGAGSCGRVHGARSPNLTVMLAGGINCAAPWRFRCFVVNDCGSITSNPATVSICAANFNCQGGVTVQDIFDFLGAYFGHENRADFNGSGSISVQDIFDFLAAYFTGC